MIGGPDYRALYQRQKKIPEWFKSCPRRKPDICEPGQLRTDREVFAEDCIRNGTDRLLSRIRDRHPGVVAFLTMERRA